uniref:Putative LuxR regulatory protein n=1 Tax=Streptomyces sp. DSM 11171 TaxID=1740725 RepID=A0A0P0K4D1_9ACTN|nr:putative LuxR regulatory protein [Streptomyces sp. DSM 11171]
MSVSERDDELQLLDQLYARCVLGKGAVVLTNGPVGCGKTALLHMFAGWVKAKGAVFASVTASASERLHLFGLIDQLVTALRTAGMDADPFAAEDVGVTVSVSDHPRVPRVPLGLLQRISRAICEFAEDRPLIIGIDDVHVADEPSLQCLRYLIRRIDSSAVLVVLNESSCHERDLAALHAETLHLPYCHRIRLAPLTPAGVTGQLARRLGAVPDETAAAWADASGGNPLLLHALIEDHPARNPAPRGNRARAAAPGPPEPGESFRHAFLRCLHRCEPAMLSVARALAVLGESAMPALVGELLGADAATSVPRGLADLNAAGLLAGERFRHERARQAVLADMAPEDLTTMHGRAAELLHESGASARVVAEQLTATHDSVRAAWRVSILREAAREATGSGDIAASVGYLRHAAGICEDAAQEARIAAALADAQWLTDPARAARHLPHLSHLVRAGLLTGEDAVIPVKHLLWRGDFAEADALLGTLECAAGGAADQPWSSSPAHLKVARLWLAFCRPGTAGPPDATAPGAGTGQTCRPGPRPFQIRTFLDLTASLSGDGDKPLAADQVLHSTHAGSPLAPAMSALLFLIETYRQDEAALWADRLLEEPWIRQAPVRRAMFETVKSAAALRGADFATAGESARTALELVSPQSWGVVVGLPLALAVRAATELGDYDTVLHHINIAVPPVMFGTPFALPYFQALGRYHLAMGRPDTALTNFRSCGDLVHKWRLDSPELVDWRNDAAAALTALGQTGRARTLIEEQLSLLGDRRSRARGVALRRLAAVSSGRDRLLLLKEAIRILAACGDPLELHRAQNDLEDALDATHPTRDARDTHQGRGTHPTPDTHRARGPGAARDTRDGPDTHAAPEETDPLPGRVTSPLARKIPSPGRRGAASPHLVLTDLTDAERRVGALAAAGCTNREIAGRLFITVSTVEQHLTKVYRKLKVRSRSDLPAELTAFASDNPCFLNER